MNNVISLSRESTCVMPKPGSITHQKALRIVGVLAGMPCDDRAGAWALVQRYVTELDLLSPAVEPGSPLRSRRGANIPAEIAGIPAPAAPQTISGSKRRSNAWARGVQARREGRARSDHQLFGLESIETFGAAWDAMDAAIRAAQRDGETR